MTDMILELIKDAFDTRFDTPIYNTRSKIRQIDNNT